ncbi:MAG: HAMP domain-containing protein [Gammaproteobacteria bacterium]|nr:HAMP domain-containing protein [Gammaproteobacteria bacterium]
MNRQHNNNQLLEQAASGLLSAVARGRALRHALSARRLLLRAWWRRQLPDYIPIAVKLALFFALLITLGMVSLGIVIGAKQSVQLSEQIDKFGTTLVQRMAETAREPLLANDTLNMELIVNTLSDDANIDGAAIFADDYKLVVQAGMIPPATRLPGVGSYRDSAPALIYWQHQKGGLQEPAYVSFITPIIFRDITVGYVLLSFDHSVMTKARRDTLATVIGVTLLMLLAAIIASFYLGRRLTRPIEQLLAASSAFSQGKFEYRIQDKRNDELGVLMQSLNTMGEGLLRKEQVEQVFSRYVSPQVARQAIRDLDSVESLQLGGRHVEASVLFADIVDFTGMSEGMKPQEVSALLNLYFGHIAEVVRFCHGHIDKYMGDCAMVVFGVPEEHEEHPFKAIACGWMILQLVEVMNRQRLRNTEPTVEFRIGVNCGTMLAGNMGSTERMEYTVVGDAVNLASRLSHAGAPGEVVLTEEMLGHPLLHKRIATHEHGTIKLRGKKEPVSLFIIDEIRDPFREEMMQEIRRILVRSTTVAA